MAFYAAHVLGEDYSVFLCGLDYDYVLEHGAYRQALYQMVHQAHLRGLRHVHLGMDADREKARYGTEIVESVMYEQARDHYNSSLLRQIVADVGVRADAFEFHGKQSMFPPGNRLPATVYCCGKRPRTIAKNVRPAGSSGSPPTLQ